MSAPCPECLDCGWRPYFVETVDGEQECAWELCPECKSEDAAKLKVYEEAEAEIADLAGRLDLFGMDLLIGVLAAALSLIRHDAEDLRRGANTEDPAEAWFRQRGGAA